MDRRTVLQISFAFLVSVTLINCEPPLNNQYGVPGNYAGSNGAQGGGGNNYHGNSYNDGQNQDYVDNQPKSYEFGYAVRDAATGNDFGRRETSDGETVRGEYRVQLPDGRTQIVTYTADWRTGFHADVRYEGEAQYPDQYNTNNGFNNNNNNNNGGQGYNQGYNGGNNNAGYQNNYRPGGSGNYQGGNNYNYQLGSNSIDNYNNNFGARNPYPSPTYGPAFH